jgi:3-isopropylmalate dehydrogenase
VDDYHIDAMAAHLLRRASDFDVIVTTNMFGDILSDLTAELAGSLGTGGSLNAGNNYAMAQAAHGSAPDIAGQGIANPTGLLHSAAMLLEWMCRQYEDPELQTVARRVDDGLSAVLSSGPLTQDMGGNATTAEFTRAVMAHVEKSPEKKV